MGKKKKNNTAKPENTNVKKEGQTISSSSSVSKKLPAQEWIEQYEGEFNRYSNYVVKTDWRDAKESLDEYKLQKEIVNIVIDRLSYFLKAFEMFKDYAFVSKFKETANNIINTFTDRSEEYLKANDWTVLENPEERGTSMKKHTMIMNDLNAIRDKFRGLALNDEVDLTLPIYGDKLIPMVMEDVIKSRFPQIIEIEDQVRKAALLNVKARDIHDIVNSSTELFINMKDVPPYDHTKHYFEQPESTIQFYKEERRKFTEGITVGGTFIHPWLYWHLNYFKTDIPMSVLKGTKFYNPTKEIEIMNPPLRDNEWFVAQLLKQAREQNKAIFIFSSRRLAKALKNTEKLYYVDGTIREIGNARVGDQIYGGDGKPTTIVGVFPQGKRQLYKVVLENGSAPECDLDHLWKVYDKESKEYKVLDTNTLIKNVGRYQIPINKCLGLPESYLVSIEEISKTSYDYATCISVNNEDKTFLTTNAVVTHNTTMEASILSWTATNTANSESMVIGGNEGDLVKLSKTIEIAFGNVHPAFFIPRNTNDWDSHIQFGLKDKAGLRVPYSDIIISNVNGGRGTSTEKTAGASPATWICDEAGKFNVKPIYQASIPSFETPAGWRTNVILTATGGNNELSSSAKSMLMSPEENKLLLMDWDLLESFVPEERLVTWERRPFGIFMPAQMSYKQGIVKEKTTLGKFIGKPSAELDKIDINVTNWEQALDVINTDRATIIKDIDAYNKERMYYPIDPLESFLSSEDNPFCVKETQEHYEELRRSGAHGKSVEVSWDNNKGGLTYTFSDKPRPEYPYGGGTNPNAPVIMLEDPPERAEHNFMYVAGLDHYKTAKSKDSTSLGSLVIFKRNVNIDEWSNKVVCTYTSRPDTMEQFNETCEMLLDGYGAKCLQENTDISFQQHLVAKRKDALLLANGEEIAKAHIKATTVQANKYGLPPTKANQEYLFKILQDYVNEWIELGYDEMDNPIRVRGVTRINDLGILEEIIHYSPGANVDRLVAFSHALALSRYYDSINLMPKIKHERTEEDDRRRGALMRKRYSPYSRTYSPYSRRV